MIDNGAIFDHTLTIIPMQEGGFTVFMGEALYWGEERQMIDRASNNGKRWAFSSAADLMSWLQKHAAAKANGVPRAKAEQIDYMEQVRKSASQ